MFLGSRSRLRTAVIAAAVGAGVLTAATPAAAAPAAGTRAYLVITAPGATAGAATAVGSNGGTVWTSYDAIGVIVAHSGASDFATKMRAISGVQKVGATRTSDIPAEAANPPLYPAQTQSAPSTSEPVRTDMAQIGADKAWAVNQGSSSVTVGVLDTGVDDLHDDLKANFDAANSASCAYGKLDTRAGSWRDIDGHGTHVAGTIAAAKNGRGVVGVAPGVKIAGVRVAERFGADESLFFPENTICAMVFSGDRGFEVTNNSYYTDPWLFNCPDNADQDAILEGVKRAVAYAEGKGVLNVAAAGNENYNLASKSSDATSPNDSTPATRTITNACLSVPTEVSGVVSVASINSSNAKSIFSNFGTDKIHISAPGDNVYSTTRGGKYGSKSGTSMASPHVAGVAALLKSTNPTATPAQLRTLLATQADDLSCSDSRCAGTTAKNNFFGEGRVDAQAAVGTGTPPGNSFENTADVAIPDAGAAVTSSITVSGVTGNAPATLKVDVNIVHTYRGDLVIDLIAPDGTAYRLKASSSNDSADNVVATYQVNASSEVANGTWKLQVKDVAAQDTGYVDSWKLTF
ncbi:Proprotein convertase P-domain-containing protein [Lentzea waywayandensis]|uniref:Proprotein convertase P-domain-containing protein n=1 Tax=Lentzea waywayandensis TaxID=84724 RepID=A0A1I6D1W5_9PSEU|nr:S8 family serine peptidase [Lentzea waywayandensis]SFQ99297.1 Proprotein convertase P-domain-containing protein [Lentzea waywayandensis]